MVDLTQAGETPTRMEQEFVPDYDAQSMPSADKRAAYALEHIAFRVSRIEQVLPGSPRRSSLPCPSRELPSAHVRHPARRRGRLRTPWKKPIGNRSDE